jgi:conjugal transfer pilus assembly protein TraB
VSQYLDPLNKIKGVLGGESTDSGDRGTSRFGIMGDAKFDEEAPRIMIGNETPEKDGRGGSRSAGSRSSQTARDRRTEDADEDQDIVYLPSASLVRGVLLNGMDAPTGQGATSDPYPVTIRVTSLAFLPNKFTTNVRECFILAAGVGRLDMERVILRTERLSCVTNKNSVIDVSLDGYVTGEDGKVGLRGTVVERTGALIARAALAGLGSGLATALQPQIRNTIQTGEAGGGLNFVRPETSEVLEVGAYAGAANAMQSIADYYLDRAEQIFPVIELDALRPVVVHLTKGAELKLREDAYDAQMAKSK